MIKLPTNATRVFVLFLGISVLTGGPKAAAQTPTAATNLATGISQVRAGEFFTALFTLNQVVRQTSDRGEDVELLARAHAFRAMAYAGLNQADRARAAVALALKADPAIVVAAPDFSMAAVGLFAELRRPLPADPEAAGTAAEQMGRPQEALLAYVKAYQALPDPAPATDDRRLREKIIKMAHEPGVAPAVPDDARAHQARAQDLLDAEAILGGAAGVASQQAAAALRQAIRLAPWWPDVTFQLATVLQRLNRGDEALINLGLYRLADPDGYAARAGRAATGATPVAAKAVGPATIYVYWPEQQRGGGRQKVHCNGKRVAELQNNRYVVLTAAAGTHDLAFREKHVTAVVEGGREYHYRVSIEGQWRFAMGEQIRLTTPAAATIEMREQGMALNDARRTRGTECAPRR